MQREESKSFLPRFDRILLDGMEDLFAPRPAAGRPSPLPTAAEHRGEKGKFPVFGEYRVKNRSY